MSSDYFGELAEDIKPIVQPNGSDSAALDNVFEVLVRAGRTAPMAKSMLVPEAWSKLATKMPEAWVAMYAYSNAVMEPWDGPAALAMTDGRWVCGGLDRNGLRPMRYVVTGDGLLIAGSEAGMVPTDEMTVVEKGALGPGQMIGVDMAAGRLLPRRRDQGPAGGEPAVRRVGRLDHRPRRGDRRAPRSGRCSRAPSCAAARSRRATPSRSSRSSSTPWPRTARRRSARWATTRRPRCCRTSTGRSATTSGRTSAR